MTGRAYRDVMADRIEEWAGDDWHVYDYVDRLLSDLYAAGFQVVPVVDESFSQVATLLDNIGREVAYERQRRGISLNAAAKACGVAKSYLHSIEARTANPTADVLGRILRWFDTPFDG